MPVSWFGWVGVVAGLVACVRAEIPTQLAVSRTPENPRQCQAINESLLPTCVGAGWHNATFPNLLHHENQADAYRELKDFEPLIETNCSEKLISLLCAVYAPVCINDGLITLQPCRHLCEEVFAGCGALLTDGGYEWPAFFSCEELPSQSEHACVDVQDQVIIPDITELSQSATVSGGGCQRISSSNAICLNVGWNYTSLPNLRQHRTQQEAYAELDDFIPLIQSQCSNKLVHLLCAVYAPICIPKNMSQSDSHIPHVIGPCKELCGYVRPQCEPVMINAGFSWPEHLDCNNFPPSSYSTLCVDVPDTITIPVIDFLDTPTMPYNNITSSPNTSIVQEGSNETLSSITCEPMTGKTFNICANVGWSNVSFPNFRGHASQAKAYEELADFIPLIEQQCSNKLVHLLCAVYAPQCVQAAGSQNSSSFVVLQPCRQLCEDVHENCKTVLESHGQWPLNCSNFPETTGECFNVPNNVTIPYIPSLDLTTKPTSTPTQRLGSSGASISPSNTVSPNQPTFIPDMNTTCQAISPASTCRNMGRHFACFPNKQGHETQEQAIAEMRDFVPLIEQHCSEKVVRLLCLIYMPQCSPNEQCFGDLGPCKELCEEVNSECRSAIERNVTWSSVLDCSKYVSATTGRCIDASYITETTSIVAIDSDEVMASDTNSASSLSSIGLLSFLHLLAFSSIIA